MTQGFDILHESELVRGWMEKKKTEYLAFLK